MGQAGRPAWSSAAFPVWEVQADSSSALAQMLRAASPGAALPSPDYQQQAVFLHLAQPDSVFACPCFRLARKMRSSNLKNVEKNHLCLSKALYSLPLHFESPGEALRDQVLHLFLHSWEHPPPQGAYPSLFQQVGVRQFAAHWWSARTLVLPAHDAALMSPRELTFGQQEVGWEQDHQGSAACHVDLP